ncbi:MAG: peptidoglycan editing factor PgeF [Chloroflexi bacterium]|nr:MAG: peptidoglycan editing factor PgeF [Chloroflexota bacterium]TME57162.1 MAG: peptidoglycan editing factor PgeF [Chloroflexota bacterium]
MGLTGSTDPELVMQRRQQLADQLGFELDRAVMTVQEHGAQVVTFHRRRPEGGQCVFSTDALATDVPGQAIVTYHADCFPLLFLDGSRGVVAGAHAGWRGSLAGVATQTVQALHLAYGTAPDQLEVLIGPGICARCYLVGGEVAQQFAARYGREDRYLQREGADVRLDLEGVVRLQLEDEGVAPSRIRSAGWCTREEERWFSHRGGRPGRFLSVVVAP